MRQEALELQWAALELQWAALELQWAALVLPPVERAPEVHP